MISRKYLGNLISLLTQLKISINQKQERMEQISMEEVKKLWDATTAVEQVDLSWIADAETLNIVKTELEAHNTAIEGMKEDIGSIKNEVSGVRSDLSVTNDIIDRMLKVLKQQYNIYEPMEVSPEGALANWTYTLDPATQTVELNAYSTTATDENVVVYANYMQDNVKYATKLGPNFNFEDNTKVKTITFSDALDASNVTAMRYYFSRCTNLQKVSFNNAFKNCNINTIEMMFAGANNITSVDFENINTSSITKLTGLFMNNTTSNSNVINDILKKLDTSNVTNMYRMFYGCTNLTSLDLTSFDTHNVTDMGGMFEDCSSLTSLDLTSFDINNLINNKVTGRGAYNLFNGCNKLTEIFVSRGKWNDEIISESVALFNCGTDHVTYVD